MNTAGSSQAPATAKHHLRLIRLTRLVQVASSLTLIIGVLTGLGQLRDMAEKSKESARADKLKAYPQVRELVNEDTDVQKLIDIEKYNDDKLMPLFNGTDGKKRTGRSIYLSPEMRDLNVAGHHFENMGALVKLGYVDFDLLFEVVNFPDEFWNRTQQFRTEIRTRNWDGKKGLPDFWSNFEYLKCCYEVRRTGQVSRECRECKVRN